MAGFNDFVQVELPKRPFTEADGPAGAIPVRSQNPLAPREMEWKMPSELGLGGGTAVPALTFISGGTINGHRILAMNPNGKVTHVNKSNALHPLNLVGMSKGAADLDVVVEVLNTGFIEDINWSWVVGEPIWIGDDGYMTQSDPNTGIFIMQIGIAVTPTKFYFNWGHPIFF